MYVCAHQVWYCFDDKLVGHFLSLVTLLLTIIGLLNAQPMMKLYVKCSMTDYKPYNVTVLFC